MVITMVVMIKTMIAIILKTFIIILRNTIILAVIIIINPKPETFKNQSKNDFDDDNINKERHSN